MKLLIIGLDGIDRSVLERGWTPHLEALSKSGHHLQLYEDLLSRGWSEIMLGKHAHQTGALYERPTMGGAHGWTESFKMSDVPGLGISVRPFWEIANKRGLRVGIMNVPTTFPAPPVDGFFVSGGGGGGPASEAPEASQVYPPELRDQLVEQGYIVDRRFDTLFGERGAFEPKEAFSLLIDMIETRIRQFDKLVVSYDIDFGFLAFKSSVSAEAMILQEIEKMAGNRDDANELLLQAGRDYYVALDAGLAQLIEETKPEEVLIVSDHSTTVRTAQVNPNAFLAEAGYQGGSGSLTKKQKGRFLYDISRKARHFIPLKLRAKLKKSKAIRSKFESMTPFDSKSAVAFCMAHSNGAHGIYINDRERFGGPVDPSEISKLTDEIVAKFEAHRDSVSNGFRASAKPPGKGRQHDQFPDVVLDLPDGFHTSTRGKTFVELTPLPVQTLSLKDLAKDLRLTAKGHIPLALSVKSPWCSAAKTQPDLRAVYQQAIAIIEEH